MDASSSSSSPLRFESESAQSDSKPSDDRTPSLQATTVISASSANTVEQVNNHGNGMSLSRTMVGIIRNDGD